MNIETLLAALYAGEISPEGRQWLIDGLEAWQRGCGLEHALGLHSSPLDRRDETLRLALRLTPGTSDTARCSFLIECLNGRQHPSPTAEQLLCKLNGIPKSVRHLRRILSGSRCDRRPEDAVLCPTWPRPDNS